MRLLWRAFPSPRSFRRGVGGRGEISLRASQRTGDTKDERDHEGGGADDRVDEAHVAGALDEDAPGERAYRVRGPRENHRDADHTSEHVIRDDRLPQRSGVDVEEDPEAGAERPEDDGDPERGGVRESDGEEAGEHERTQGDVTEGPSLP